MTRKNFLKKMQLIGIAKKKVKITFCNFFIWACNENLNKAF